MNSRYLPIAVFVICVLVGFGLGLEAEGQSKTSSDWTAPEWELPWGMTWPALPPEPVEAPTTGDAVIGTKGEEVSSDDEGDLGPSVSEDDSASAGSAPEPGIFPGLVNPPEEAGSDEVSAPEAAQEGAPAGAAGTPEVATLNAQLAQLQALDEQLKAMSEANQSARAAVEAAISGQKPEPEEPEVQATPEQIEQSLVLLTDMVKKMKPAKAAEILAQWDEALAIGILRRLGSRRATPVLSKMPVTLSGRLTSRIAAGVAALPSLSAEDAAASPQGGVE